jgi:G3E family GTPase
MPVPANLILGYLGTGKTTTIRSLLKHKPAEQRWGVIVNEFGEVGVDGDFLAASEVSSDEILRAEQSIIEVPGGCVCCSASLPSKQALEQLIAAQQLDRILIEPTGLAHPRNVVALFSGTQFADLIELQATVTLVDPWYFEHNDYQQLENYELQMALADVLVANKSDKATEAARLAFRHYAAGFSPQKSHVAEVEFGELDWQYLTLPRKVTLAEQEQHSHAFNVQKKSFARAGIQRKESRFEGAYACGWLFEICFSFHAESLKKLLRDYNVARVKGIVQTDQGWVFINRMGDDWEWFLAPQEAATQWQQSRLEVLHDQPVDWEILEAALCACIGE